MSEYAENTTVNVATTKHDIGREIARFGGSLLNIDDQIPGRAVVMFQSAHTTPRYLRVTLPYPVGPGTKNEQERRSRWRGLLLSIKAKCVSVRRRIETFDQAFMAWIIGPDGKTLYEKALEIGLLPAPEDRDRDAA
jgi:hypothetical protein